MKNSIFATPDATSLVLMALEARVGGTKGGASLNVSSAPTLGQTFNIEQ
jgi:hypothetical protein